MRRKATLLSLQTAIIYALFAGGWILLGDKLLSGLAEKHTFFAHLQDLKDLLFILLSALLIYLLIHRSFLALESAEQELHHSRENHRALVEASPLAIIATDMEGRVTLWNRGAQKTFGWREEEVLGEPNPIDPPERLEEFDHLRTLALTGESTTALTVTRRRRDGTLIDVSLSTAAIHAPGEGIVGIMAILEEITLRKAAETRLQESEARYRLLFENNPQPMWVYDLETLAFLAVNRAAVSHYGYSREEFLSMTIGDIRPKEDLSRLRANVASVSEGIDHAGLWRHRRKDGTLLEVEITSHTLDFSGRRAELVLVSDVTERRRQERELGSIARLAAVLRPARSCQEMYPLILDSMLELVEVEGACLLQRDPASGLISDLLGRPRCGGGAFCLAPDGPAARVFRSGLPVISQDLSAEPDFAHLCTEEGARALACLPLQAHGETVCVLCAGSHSPIPEREIHLLGALGDIAASAIHRSSLHEKTQEQLERLYALRQIDMAITESLDLRRTLNVLLEEVAGKLKVDAASVLLYQPEQGKLEVAAARGFRTPVSGMRPLRFGECGAGRAAQLRQIVIHPDLKAVPPEQFLRRELLSREGFVSYYGVPLIARSEVKGVLELFHRSPQERSLDWLEFLESLGMQAAIALDTAFLFDDLQRSNADLLLAYDETIEGWSQALDLRDRETEGHSLRVTDAAVNLARALGMCEEELIHVRWGALLHDIGKMGIPDDILLKPGKLSEEEWSIMRRHPTFAFRLLSPIAHLRQALDIPYCHHEKWDGTGYPRGLKGEQIPLAARIFAVIDVWDALTSDRPYRKAWTAEEALALIGTEAGRHFDPEVVETFLSLRARDPEGNFLDGGDRHGS